MLFTKADLLAGFVEFYDDLDVEGRRAVLGSTLPWGRAPTGDALAGEFDDFAQSIADRTSKRLQDEPDARRRGLILGFPTQVDGLRSRVLRFLEGAFIADRGPSDPAARLLLHQRRAGRRAARPASSPASPRSTRRRSSTATGQGRAYFLNRLLSEVVFAEAGLVQTERTAEARRSAQLTGGAGGDRRASR